jgi:hypothetical protein
MIGLLRSRSSSPLPSAENALAGPPVCRAPQHFRSFRHFSYLSANAVDAMVEMTLSRPALLSGADAATIVDFLYSLAIPLLSVSRVFPFAWLTTFRTRGQGSLEWESTASPITCISRHLDFTQTIHASIHLVQILLPLFPCTPSPSLFYLGHYRNRVPSYPGGRG